MVPALSVDQETQLAYTLLAPPIQDALAGEDALSATSTPGSVTVICFHGSGKDGNAEPWLLLVEEISKLVPVLFYVRRGHGQDIGEEESRMQTPEEATRDLVLLLKSRQVQPPYILVAHSYGGTVAREFLQGHERQVAGMMLAETALATPNKHEQEQYRRQILGARPLSVIQANSRLAGIEGTQNASAEQKGFAKVLAKEAERLNKAQLRLSSKSRYVRVTDCGHHIVRDRPDIVVQEVGWVINNCTAVSPTKSRPSIADHFMRVTHRVVRSCMPGRVSEGHHKT